jgi:hypothetical protein
VPAEKGAHGPASKSTEAVIVRMTNARMAAQ